MSVSSVSNCPVCLEPLGATVEDRVDLTKYVTTILHKPQIGPAHEIHRICAFQWFSQQLEQEPEGIDPNDLDNIPFSCPQCRESLSLRNAEEAAGVPLAATIRIMRQFKQSRLAAVAVPQPASFCPCIIL